MQGDGFKVPVSFSLTVSIRWHDNVIDPILRKKKC